MHYLDELILRNALKALERAQASIKEGGPVNEIMATMQIAFAKSDIEVVLKTQPAKTEA